MDKKGRKSPPRRPSYHVNVAFSSQGRNLDVCAAGLGRLVRRQEASSVDQAGWHRRTEHRAAVDADVSVAVRVSDIFSALP